MLIMQMLAEHDPLAAAVAEAAAVAQADSDAVVKAYDDANKKRSRKGMTKTQVCVCKCA